MAPSDRRHPVRRLEVVQGRGGRHAVSAPSHALRIAYASLRVAWCLNFSGTWNSIARVRLEWTA
jgi:hypothetical protein